jgi:MinD-like ATPase involved in chromosome partitioning or flagellar assembly
MAARIVSIHSFRGGTGKSNVTANVAATLTARGNRVAVVDTDIQSPGVHVLFGLDEERVGHTLNHFLWDRIPIEQAAYDVTSTVGAGGDGRLWVIPSSMDAGDIARILREGFDVELLNDGYREAIHQLDLDYLLVDTHPGLNEETLLSMAVSDVLILILRPDQQDFEGTAVTVRVARKLEVPSMYMLVNKCLAEYDRTDLRRRVEETYGAEVAGILPFTEDVARLASGGLFSRRFPEHGWSEGIVGVADVLEGAGVNV